MNLGFLRLLIYIYIYTVYIYIYMIIYEYIVLLSSLNFCSVPLVLSNNAIYTEAACAEAEGTCYGSFDHPTLIDRDRFHLGHRQRQYFPAWHWDALQFCLVTGNVFQSLNLQTQQKPLLCYMHGG